jgi:hypothetical protein
MRSDDVVGGDDGSAHGQFLGAHFVYDASAMKMHESAEFLRQISTVLPYSVIAIDFLGTVTPISPAVPRIVVWRDETASPVLCLPDPADPVS